VRENCHSHSDLITGTGHRGGEPQTEPLQENRYYLNDDGQPDVVALNFVVAGLSPGTNRFFLNGSQAAGTFTLGDGTDISADADMSSGGTLADFDGNGDLDIAVAKVVGGGAGGSARNKLYLNQFIESGNVAFVGIDISANEHQSRELAAGDINDDGHIDLIVGNQAFGDVPGRDGRHLNNGTADPFTNVAPVIDGYTGTLATDQDTALAIVLDEVTVTDPDNAFPADFTLTVQPGTNYTATDNSITPDAGFSGELVVPVVVSDGTDDSAAFDLAVTVTGPGAGNNPPPSPAPPSDDDDSGGGSLELWFLLALIAFGATGRRRRRV
jgi:MYXO-CTERM domain-containing protein